MTAVSLPARGGLRQHLVPILLALSLALNLFFIAGALWIRIHGPPPMSPAERLGRVGAQLALDPEQKQVFEQYVQGVRTRMQAMHKAVDPLVNNAWSEVAKPDADEAKVIALFDEAAQTRREYMREMAPITLSFLAKLSPEQRTNFVDLIRQRPWDKPH